MESRNDILNELMQISPAVAGISHLTPYQVPQGYFEGLEELMKQRLAGLENTGSDPVLNIPKDNAYQVPEGYFDGLANTILNRIKADEAKDANEELELLSPALNRINKTNPFTVPAGYFSELPENIVSGVQAVAFVNEELENLAPWMTALKHENVYTVPQGYFDTLAGNILAKTKQQPARVISFDFTKKIIRYAAAAVVVGVIAIGAWIAYKPGNTIDVAKIGPGMDTTISPKLKPFTDEDIQNFVDNNGASLADVTVTTGDITTDDTKVLFADISDDELQQYLQEHGGATSANNN